MVGQVNLCNTMMVQIEMNHENQMKIEVKCMWKWMRYKCKRSVMLWQVESINRI